MLGCVGTRRLFGRWAWSSAPSLATLSTSGWSARWERVPIGIQGRGPTSVRCSDVPRGTSAAGAMVPRGTSRVLALGRCKREDGDMSSADDLDVVSRARAIFERLRKAEAGATANDAELAAEPPAGLS